MLKEISATTDQLITKEQHWLPIVEQWKISKQTSKYFCQRLNLNLDQFNYWRRKLVSKKNVVPSKFFKIKVNPVESSATHSSMLVELPSLIKITIPLNIDASQLVKVLSLLGVYNA